MACPCRVILAFFSVCVALFIAWRTSSWCQYQEDGSHTPPSKTASLKVRMRVSMRLHAHYCVSHDMISLEGIGSVVCVPYIIAPMT